jgi:hypothetical protein
MRVRLLQHTAAHLTALQAGPEAYERISGYRLADGLGEMACGPETSPEFIARQKAAAATDVWLHGFAIVEAT